MKTIQKRPLADLESGMRVAVAVTDASGRVLLPAGAELTAAMIASLERREIADVAVEVEVAEDPAVVAAYRSKIQAQLDKLFRRAGAGAETRALYDVILAYRLEQCT